MSHHFKSSPQQAGWDILIHETQMSHSHHFASTALSSFGFMAVLQRFLTLPGIFICLVWNAMTVWRTVNPNRSSSFIRSNRQNRNQQYWNISNNGNNCNSVSAGPWDAEKYLRDPLCVVGQDVVCTLMGGRASPEGAAGHRPHPNLVSCFRHKCPCPGGPKGSSGALLFSLGHCLFLGWAALFQ